ncbi:MAG: DNA N-6-adenine-methyltransferase [Mycobacteriaceae bacterium]
MSLVNFSAQNHPQQTSARGPKDEVDDRGTHPDLFDPLNERFDFTLDVAAAPHNAKCASYITRNDDGLARSWYGRVWCNPPYSDIGAWVRKAWAEWEREEVGEQGAPPPEVIAMLLPANRTEQGWWQDHVEPHLRKRTPYFRVEFLRGRPRFIRPNWTPGPKGDRPPFGCCLLIWGYE